jgi:hypothetical protein
LRFEKRLNSADRSRAVMSVMTLPEATSMAAQRLAIPCRRQSWVRRWGIRGSSGRTGEVRSIEHAVQVGTRAEQGLNLGEDALAGGRS